MREQTLTDIIERTMGSQRTRGGFGVHNYDSGRYRDIHANPDKYAITTSQYAPGPGYESSGITMEGYSNDDDAKFYVFQKRQPTSPTVPTVEYRTDPAQAEQIAALQKQLKILQDVPKYEPYDFSKERAEYQEKISGLNERIGTIQSGYKTSLADLTAQMQSEREAAEKQLGLSFQSQLSEQQKTSQQKLAEQQAMSAQQLGELKNLYQSQLGSAALERQTLQQTLERQQKRSAASQLKFEQSLAAQQQTAAADRLKFSETLSSQQSAAQKEFEALRGTMSQQRQQYEAGLAAERAANEQARQEQAMSFQRSLASQRGAPQVEGIRFATRGPAAQKSMRGISGTFGRKGGRLMKISALNV
ncbi:hypothetical protein [uncultured phage_MedDCM-OCT-S28-C3]|uniref:Uncharacterized protein n=1 Tax=uncultured phage_MedDCM-OCT-S28-C3 TaxID=2740802 RepID=A0A6S4P9M9_9CAUD|nr:hypothetical protein HOQ59_gp48 [uncultured phage_MedDCM-OCT-S28-C3]BAQ94042.1 hypothetical protein [uncultured phage_MedDCM-OCT-S28-C3]